MPASLFEVGRNCCAVARAQRVALLVDGDAYFSAFRRAAERAQQSITILAWDFSSTTCLCFERESRHAPPARLGDFLNWLARRRHELQVRVLDWDYPMVFGTERELPPVWGLGWTPHHRVEIAYDNTHPVGGSHHQKIVVIDDALAFVGGFDLTDRRWDTPQHTVADPRRRCGSADYPPFHDLMMAVDGAAARVLADVARARWLAATGDALPPVAASGDPWPPELAVDLRNVEVAVARTLPASPTQPAQPAVSEVEALYLDMIAAARDTIYIENQYFTAGRIGNALAARLAEPDGPEIVLVLRYLSHGWLEEHTMHVLRTELIRRLRAADRHRRFFLYYVHSDGLKEGTCVDIHSKLMIVDDEVLRIGSANLSNRSMGLDSECDAAIAAGGDAAVAEAIHGFRNRLLGEHLDVPPERVEAVLRQHGSLPAAIDALAGRAHTLKPLEPVPVWSEAVLDLARIADPGSPVSVDGLVEEYLPRSPAAPAGPPGLPTHRLGWRAPLIAVGVLGLVVGGLVAFWRYTPLADYLHPSQIVVWAQAFASRWWAPLLVLVAYTPACLVMFPRPLITLGAVVAFGPIKGALYALAGVLLSALATYVIGRWLPRRSVRHVAGHQLNRIAETLRRRGLLAVTALRLLPVAPFAVLGLVAGAVRIKLWHFMLGTFIGILPGTFFAALFGNEIGAALRDPSQLSIRLIVALLVGVVVVGLLISKVVRRWLAADSAGIDASRGGRVPVEAGHG